MPNNFAGLNKKNAKKTKEMRFQFGVYGSCEELILKRVVYASYTSRFGFIVISRGKYTVYIESFVIVLFMACLTC